jgi:hypothetical protein
MLANYNSASSLAAAALLLAAASAAPIGVRTNWTCAELSSVQLAPGARWQRLKCSGVGIPLFGPSDGIVVNVVVGDLSAASGLRLVPGVAAVGPSGFALDSLDRIAAAQGGGGSNILAGINAGYFYRLDVATFFDGVCIGKGASDAKQAPSLTAPNNGITDGTTVVGGKLLGSNCDCPGFSRPVILTIDGVNSRFDVLTRGAEPPEGLAKDAVGAGPNLVSANASGSYVDIPSDDDNIGNILEHAANTGVGLRPTAAGGVEALLVTTDGYDGCGLLNSTCGTNAFSLAYLFKDYFNATTAMAMDQGGSTTMFVAGQPDNGIVSHSGGGARAIASALFLAKA